MVKKQKKIDIGAKSGLFLAALIWGSSFFMVKDTVDTIPPNFLLAVRFTIGSILLALVFYKRLKNLNREYIVPGIIIGLCLFLAYASQTIGIIDTTPGKNAFLTGIYCVIVPFLFWAADKDKPDIYNITAAFLCLAGIGLVSLTGGFSIGRGDALTILGGFFYALHMVMVAKLASDKDPVLISILQFAVAAILSWAATLLFETQPSVITGAGIGAILYLAIGCTALGLLLQIVGQKYTHPAAASVIMSLEAVFGVFFSVLLYGEKLTGRLVLGFLLIFIAIFISETKLDFLKRQNIREQTD